mmetsp:Transcript_31302/g.72958  ORF Transcript_31302/g.72958 Transcript_31302/m.72958 type:complete len:275 (+) Transcript_31302:827-1651(+)
MAVGHYPRRAEGLRPGDSAALPPLGRLPPPPRAAAGAAPVPAGVIVLNISLQVRGVSGEYIQHLLGPNGLLPVPRGGDLPRGSLSRAHPRLQVGHRGGAIPPRGVPRRPHHNPCARGRVPGPVRSVPPRQVPAGPGGAGGDPAPRERGSGGGDAALPRMRQRHAVPGGGVPRPPGRGDYPQGGGVVQPQARDVRFRAAARAHCPHRARQRAPGLPQPLFPRAHAAVRGDAQPRGVPAGRRPLHVRVQLHDEHHGHAPGGADGRGAAPRELPSPL